jgi:hypothetical protein
MGERDEANAGPVPVLILFAPHENTAFMPSNSVPEQHKARLNPAGRLDPDPVPAQVHNAGQVIAPGELLKGHHAQCALPLHADLMSLCLPVLLHAATSSLRLLYHLSQKETRCLFILDKHFSFL